MTRVLNDLRAPSHGDRRPNSPALKDGPTRQPRSCWRGCDAPRLTNFHEPGVLGASRHPYKPMQPTPTNLPQLSAGQLAELSEVATTRRDWSVDERLWSFL